MAKDDEILTGDPVELINDTDSDGDGVGDMQERLEGTDPLDASDHLRRDPKLSPDAGDPRGDLDPASLEREVGFDPTAQMPEGMSVESGLAGLKNLDGSDLPTGTNRYGVGEDDILDGRLGANSPLDMERNPLSGSQGAASSGFQSGGVAEGGNSVGQAGGSFSDGGIVTQGGGMSSGHGSRPPGQGPSGSADPGNNPDLVAGWGTDWAAYQGKAVGEGIRGARIIAEEIAEMPKAAYEAFVKAATEPLETPDPPKPDPPKTSTDPDADPGGPGGVVSEEELSRIVTTHGGDTDFVEGYGGGPQIGGDGPPVRYIDLVTDGGDDSGTTDAPSGEPRGAPDAPVINTINPDLGIDGPPTGDPPPSGGGGGGGDDFGLTGGSAAATAASDDGTDAPGIGLAGSGEDGGIASVAPDAGAAAVDTFATEYLEDASRDAAAPDFANSGLAADLGGDPAAQVDEFESPVLDDPGAEPHDEFATVDRDDGFDG